MVASRRGTRRRGPFPVKERFTQLGVEAFPMTPEAFNAYIRTEMESAARIAKAAKLQVQ